MVEKRIAAAENVEHEDVEMLKQLVYLEFKQENIIQKVIFLSFPPDREGALCQGAGGIPAGRQPGKQDGAVQVRNKVSIVQKGDEEDAKNLREMLPTMLRYILPGCYVPFHTTQCSSPPLSRRTLPFLKKK